MDTILEAFGDERAPDISHTPDSYQVYLSSNFTVL